MYSGRFTQLCSYEILCSIQLFILNSTFLCPCCSLEYEKSLVKLEMTTDLMITRADLQGYSSFAVSASEMEAFLHYDRIVDGRKVSDFDSVSVSGNKVQAYIIQYERGWKLVSADKRTDPILAESSEGFIIDKKYGNAARKEYVEVMLQEIANLQSLATEEQTIGFVGEDKWKAMRESLYWWDMIAHPTKLLSQSLTKIRPELGIYVLDTVVVDTLVSDIVDHQIVTHWHQSYPYNSYCPMVGYNGDVFPGLAGCVPIAGAQMLYYLHDRYNVPQYSPDSAFCTGVYPYHLWAQYGSSATAWSEMQNQDGDAAAVLIASLAKQVDAFFAYGVTTAATSDLVSVFSSYGIESAYHLGCDVDSLKNHIMIRHMPVIARASSESGLIGHCFIIDAMSRNYCRKTFYYKWVGKNGYEGPGYHESLILDDDIWRVSMNWGYGDDFDGEWYNVDGHWLCDGIRLDYGRNTILGYNVL